jgi:hypothetical protein
MMRGTQNEIVASLAELEKQDDPWTFSRRMDARLFGEIPGRVLVGISEDKQKAGAIERIQQVCSENNLNLHCLGLFDHSRTELSFVSPSGVTLTRNVSELHDIYETAIPTAMGD